MPTERQPQEELSSQEAPLETTQTEPQTIKRLASLDICRGIAILAVLFIHVSGHFLPALHLAKSHVPPGWAWYALAVPNLDAQWAVPCFLMLSAFANALSLARTPDITRYAKRRLRTAVVPYVLWSGVYIALNFALGTLHHLNLGHLAKLLLTGTAEFHLYFFVLVIELYVLLPLLMPLFRRRPAFWAVALGAVILQAAVYLLNRFVLLHRFQTTILWDILPVALGLWLWSQIGRWSEVFKRGLWPALIVTLAALAVYTSLGIQTLLPPAHINTAVYQGGQWAFTAGMSFLVLALAGALVKSRGAALLSYLGAESLAIYVMHPLAIIALDKLGTKSLGAGAGMVVYYALCLGLPLAAVRVWKLGKAPLDGSSAPK
jgi:peptidoglycan/LPS O-acetylase OafA/YrhL